MMLMEQGGPHVLSDLNPSYLSTVRVRITGHGLYKHILIKNLHGGRPNPVSRTSAGSNVIL